MAVLPPDFFLVDVRAVVFFATFVSSFLRTATLFVPLFSERLEGTFLLTEGVFFAEDVFSALPFVFAAPLDDTSGS